MKDTVSLRRISDSGRPKTARVEANIDAVSELVLPQENAPQTHRTDRQIARETHIPPSSVSRTIHNDLHLEVHQKRSCTRTYCFKLYNSFNLTKNLLNN